MFSADSLKKANLHWCCDCHFWPLLTEPQKWDWSQIEAYFKSFHFITFEKSLLIKTFFFFALSCTCGFLANLIPSDVNLSNLTISLLQSSQNRLPYWRCSFPAVLEWSYKKSNYVLMNTLTTKFHLQRCRLSVFFLFFIPA